MSRTRRTDVTLFLCGDVMTGRGIDQVLEHPGSPELFEEYAWSAHDYVRLAESASGPIGRPLSPRELWADGLAELERRRPAARIINLETAITTSNRPWPGKGIHYRMHPGNIDCLTVPRIDCCVLANNHVLDWGRPGLLETLDTLHAAGLRTAGAGRDAPDAASPAAIPLEGSRVLVFAFAMPSSGVPPEWAAAAGRPGVNVLDDLSSGTVERIAAEVREHRRDGDLVVVSVHWGPNWGFAIHRRERAFAHGLVDSAVVDVVHGHSSHHVRGIEVHRGKLILYGCGDLINDYEGIGGQESFRGDLALGYFPRVERATGNLVGLDMVPLRQRRFALRHAGPADTAWLEATLRRECERLGTGIAATPDGNLMLRWGL